MSEDASIIQVPAADLSLLRKALTLAAEGAFDEAVRLLASPPPGELGAVQQAVGSLITDYRIAVEQSALSIEEFSASRHELEKKLEMIEAQRAAIQRLSAPIIDVWDDIVVVPLIGLLDGGYTQELAERLLSHIERTHISWVILDLTGTDQIDAKMGDHLIRLASAVRLMGAAALLTGIGAEAARMLVSLRTSLEGLRSRSSLRDGLKFCLAQRGLAGR